MAEKHLNAKDSVVLIEEIESRLEKILSKRKEEIERELEERIRAEKEEATKKIEAIQKEIGKGKEILHDYRTVISEFETERAALQVEIKEHFDKAVAYQTDIEKMAGLTVEELRKVNELNKKLETLHQTAEERVNTFKKDLEERFGIVAELPESKEEMELKIDLDKELSKLKKIKELLETETAKAVEFEPAEPAVEAVSEEAKAEEAPVTNEQGVPLKVPEINEVVESALAGEGEAESKEAPPEETAWREERDNFQALFEALEKYRRIEPRNGNGEIGLFKKGDLVILDGEYMVASIDESLEEAKKLYVKLSQTESPKEQFFIKQEIINHQEILRKYILRNLKMCEREGAVLPQFTADILNLDVLKNILEKLSMENWSNPSDFSSFRTMIESLKDSYYAKITPPVYYLRSLLEELGD